MWVWKYPTRGRAGVSSDEVVLKVLESPALWAGNFTSLAAMESSTSVTSRGAWIPRICLYRSLSLMPHRVTNPLDQGKSHFLKVFTVGTKSGSVHTPEGIVNGLFDRIGKYQMPGWEAIRDLRGLNGWGSPCAKGLLGLFPQHRARHGEPWWCVDCGNGKGECCLEHGTGIHGEESGVKRKAWGGRRSSILLGALRFTPSASREKSLRTFYCKLCT